MADKCNDAFVSMDGYLAKPVQTRALYDEIERVVAVCAQRDPSPAPEPPGPPAPHDRGTPAARAPGDLGEGDKELQPETVDLFLSTAPGHMRALQQALAARNVAATRLEASNLKAAADAIRASLMSEKASQIGIAVEVTGPEATYNIYTELEREFDTLMSFLATFRRPRDLP